jgi:hypothetical protein
VRVARIVTSLVMMACGQPSSSASSSSPSSAPAADGSATARTKRPVSPATSLAQKLVADTYGELFSWPEHDETVAKVWNEPANRAALESLIDDVTAPPKARFIAAEVLYGRDFTFISRHDRGAIARIYAFALQHNLCRLNAWGYVWYSDSTGPGPAGSHLVGLHKAAIPVLRELLEDRTVLQGYVGSEQAMIGNGAKFRVRDFAAYYLSRILNNPVGLREEPAMQADYAMRDAAIDKLTASIDKLAASLPAD